MSSSLPRIDSNILPGSAQEKRVPGRDRLLIIILAFLLVLTVILLSVTSNSSRRKSDLSVQRDLLNKQLMVSLQKGQRLAEINGVIEKYRVVNQKQGVATKDFNAVVESADKSGISVISVLHEGAGQTIKVECRALSYSNFDEYRQFFGTFAKVLMETERFASVDYQITDYPPRSSVIFYMNPK